MNNQNKSLPSTKRLPLNGVLKFFIGLFSLMILLFGYIFFSSYTSGEEVYSLPNLFIAPALIITCAMAIFFVITRSKKALGFSYASIGLLALWVTVLVIISGAGSKGSLDLILVFVVPSLLANILKIIFSYMICLLLFLLISENKEAKQILNN